ncbi:hypothetical protein KFE25_011905 [Diacronema lutheri]|uniref:F-box domain-containing protein n=1 Tax=Diacronema lutheri TaxID=2081491 RepID=A0A8J5XGK9_DIALT|nr:hypothetical protein KFE25_011905 [Diacronema lutheri]
MAASGRSQEREAELLAVMLELRAQMATMRAQIERTCARVALLDERVARMERAERTHVGARRVAPCVGAGAARRVPRAPERELRLDGLPTELLVLVAAALPEDDELAASLCCRKLRSAVAQRRAADGRDGTRTAEHTACTSDAKLAWAVLGCGLRLTPRLCAFAAARGSLTQLSWLRAHGCPWDAHTFTAGAASGHLSVLRWAHAKGLAWGAMRGDDDDEHNEEDASARFQTAESAAKLPAVRTRVQEPPLTTASGGAACCGEALIAWVRAQPDGPSDDVQSDSEDEELAGEV